MLAAIDRRISERVTRFYAYETLLLDDNRLHEWLDLVDDDVLYTMPMRETRLGEEPKDQPPTFYLFNDDKTSLETRVARLDTGFALVESPVSATQRLVTDVFILEATAAHIDVRSSILVFQVREERNETLFVGHRTDRLRIIGDELRLLRRDIRLAHYVLPRTISLFF